MNEPMLDLNERRKRLRVALAHADTGDTAGFAAALAGASEEDRAALARTLPAAKLFKAEGPTPRACFVLAALGKPAVIVETIRPGWIASNHSPFGESWQEDKAHAKLLREAEPVMEKFFLAASHGRDRAWQLAFIDALAQGWNRNWSLARGLIQAHALAPESEHYLDWFLSHLTWNDQQREKRGAAEMAAMLTESNNALLTEFWALFRFEGMGGNWNVNDSDSPLLLQAIAILCDTVPGFRDRALDESLGALLRDFSASNTRWYPRVHRALDPTADEVAARAGRYMAVLAAGPSTSVGLAQDMLARAIGRIAPNDLLDASAGVLGRGEKKLLTAQLKLLAALVKARPECAAQVSELVAGVVDTLPADVAAAARKLILPGQGGVAAPEAPPGTAGATPIAVPAPRRAAISHEPERLAPIASEDELWPLVSSCLEGAGHGRDLARILDDLSRHPDLAAGPPVLARAADVMASVWDQTDASPRRHLADLLLSRAGRQPRQVLYRGYLRHWFGLTPGAPLPEDAVVKQHGTWSSGYRCVPTQAPTALLMAQFHAGAGRVATTPLPAAAREWQRAMLPPGKGQYEYGALGREPKPVWLPAGKAQGPTFAGGDLGVGHTQEEYTLRAEEAREQDGFEQIVQWAAWLLSENPDTLAAIYHPVFDAAVRVVNVRGVGALLAALGQTRQPPRGPVWSALALGLSAKMPEHRAAAAESLAALAASGLLDPAPLAAEIAAHLKDELALAGRLAAALADAASISPIAGYRTLQTLAALLPHLDGVSQAVKLIELTARLAADYGTPVPVPGAFAGKRKGSSVMAVALRALDAATPRPTPLAQDAAAQAAAAPGA